MTAVTDTAYWRSGRYRYQTAMKIGFPPPFCKQTRRHAAIPELSGAFAAGVGSQTNVFARYALD